MLVELYPRFHARFSSLPLLGPHIDPFVVWLRAQGYPRLPIRLRIRETPRVDARLRRRGVRRLTDLSRLQLLALAPRDSQADVYFAALVRSLARYLDEQDVFTRLAKTRSQQLVETYRVHLDDMRGLAEATVADHASTASELLAFLRYDANSRVLQRLKSRQIEEFIKIVARLLTAV